MTGVRDLTVCSRFERLGDRQGPGLAKEWAYASPNGRMSAAAEFDHVHMLDAINTVGPVSVSI